MTFKNFNKLFGFSALLIVIILAIGIIHFNKLTEKTEIIIDDIIPLKTESELILDSDLIVSGTVNEIKASKWSNPHFQRGKNIRNILQTDIVIFVEEVLSGELSEKTVTVRIDKGEDSKTIVHSDGYPDFTIGENVLLFLSRDDSDVATNENYYVLTGMKFGKYILKPNSEETSLNKTYSNEKQELAIDYLKQKIKQEKNSNPDYKKEKTIRQEEIRKNNVELFGE